MATIEVKHMAAQGDVLFRRVERVPEGYEPVPSQPVLVVAHSETGHHHAIERAMGLVAYRAERDPLVSYLRLDGGDVDVVHHRPYDTHATLRLTGGAGAVWEVRRQREYTPEGWRRVED